MNTGWARGLSGLALLAAEGGEGQPDGGYDDEEYAGSYLDEPRLPAPESAQCAAGRVTVMVGPYPKHVNGSSSSSHK